MISAGEFRNGVTFELFKQFTCPAERCFFRIIPIGH